MKPLLTARRAFVLTTLVAAVVAGLLTGCRRDESPLLTALPANVEMAARIDAVGCLRLAGFDMGSDTWKAPDWLASDLGDARLGRIKGLLQAVDGSAVIAVKREPGAPVVALMKVTDRNALVAWLKAQNAVATKIDDFEAWSPEGIDWSVALRGEVAWASLTAPSSLVVEAQALAKAASEAKDGMTLAANKAFVEAMEDASHPVVWITPTKLPSDENHEGSPWIVWRLTERDNRLAGTMSQVWIDGEPAPMPGLEPISMSALQYVPASATMVVAMGLDGTLPWNTFMAPLIKDLPLAEQAQAALLIEYLKGVHGTMVVAVGPKPGVPFTRAVEQGLNGLDLLIMVRLKQQAVDQAMLAVGQLAAEYGARVSDAGRGLSLLEFPGMNWFVGNLDGYLTIASSLPNANNSNALAAKMNGKVMAALLRVPTLAPFTPCVNIGVDAEITGSSAEGRWSVGVEPRQALLPALWNAWKQIDGCDAELAGRPYDDDDEDEELLFGDSSMPFVLDL